MTRNKYTSQAIPGERASTQNSANPAGRRQNILFITLDQMRADAMHGALSARVSTPNLDRLMREGVTFKNHFAVTAPCGPSRTSLLTGLCAMNHRSIRNGTPLADRHATLATEVRKAGYEPLLFGYTDTKPDPGLLHPNDPSNGDYEGLAKGFREIVDMRFEKSLDWRADLTAKNYEVAPHSGNDFSRLYRPVPSGEEEPQIDDPALYKAKDSDSAFLTTKTLEALAVRRDAPWFAHVTYIRPHPPLVAPAPFNTCVDPEILPDPTDRSLDHSFIDAWFSGKSQRKLWWGFDGDSAAMSKQDTQKLRAVYLGLVAEVDTQIGRILDWLDETGQSPNTLIILTGDHGEMLGDKAMWGKESVFDPAFHIPLIICDPDLKMTAGTSVDHITQSIDIMPTILDSIDVEQRTELNGYTLFPFLRGDPVSDWRDAAFIELEMGEPRVATRFQEFWNLHENDCNVAIIREKRWKYVHFNGGVPPMLFDLQNDPGECNNLAPLAKYAPQLLRLAQKMLDQRMHYCDRTLTSFGER